MVNEHPCSGQGTARQYLLAPEVIALARRLELCSNGNRSGMGLGGTLLVLLWTLWLLVVLSLQCELGVFKRAAVALPERLRSHEWTRMLPIFSAEPPGNTNTGLAGHPPPRVSATVRRIADFIVSNLIILFILLGPVLLFAMDVTWRSYIMAWLIIHAIVAAAKFATNQGAALVLSTVSLAGLLWLWLQGGGAHGHYVVQVPLAAVAGLALAATVYWLILGWPEIRRRADARRKTERQLKQAERDLTAARGEQRRAQNQIGVLKDKIAPLEQTRQRLEETVMTQQNELAGLQGAYDRAVAKLRNGRSATQQESWQPDEEQVPEEDRDGEQIPDDASIRYDLPADQGDADALAAGGPGRRLVRVRCFPAPRESEASRGWPKEDRAKEDLPPLPGPAQFGQAQRRGWIIERTIVTLPANSHPRIVDPGAVRPVWQAALPGGGQHHAGFRDQIRDAFDEYAAEVIVNPAYDKVTEWWAVEDPGNVGAAAQAVGNTKAGLHQFFLGAPANSVCRALGAPAPAANAAGGVVGSLPLPVDGPMGDVKMFFQFVGIAVGVATGIPLFHIACTKSLGHDLLQKAVAKEIREIGHNLTAEDRTWQKARAPAENHSTVRVPTVSPPTLPAPGRGMTVDELADRHIRRRPRPPSPPSPPSPTRRAPGAGGRGIGGR